MRCAVASQRIQALVDGTLEAAVAARVAAHAGDCAACAAARDGWTRLFAALDNLPRDVAPPGFADAVLAAMQRRNRARPVARNIRSVRCAVAAAAAIASLALGAHAAGPDAAPSKPAPAASAVADTSAGGRDAPRQKTLAYELVKFGRNVHVHEDEVVRGDVLLVGGELRVDGEITGGAVVIGGDIHAGPRARVGGQAVAVAGRVSQAPGAVLDDAVSLSVLSAPLFARFSAQRGGDLLGDLLKLAVLIVVALPLCAWIGAPLERARARLDAAPLKCLGLGVLALPGGAFAIVVIAFLLALTLVGVPLALLLVAAAAALAFAAFFVGAAMLGARVRTWVPVVPQRLAASVVLGLVCLRVPELAADVLGFVVPSRSLRVLHAVDGVLEAAAVAAGLGALLWVRWSGATTPAPRHFGSAPRAPTA
jgi:anti-sigma factor RsiW